MGRPALETEVEADCKAREAELVIAAQAGSKDAFEELQNLHWRRLYRTVLSITRNQEDAEDALQETFLRAYVRLGQFEGRSKFSSWITRIAVNCALMGLRKRRALAEVFIEHWSDSADEAKSFDIRDSGLNPEQIYDQHQRCLSMVRAMERLDPKLLAAMRIRTVRQFPIKQIAQALDVSQSAAKTRLHRARGRLRRSFDPVGSRGHFSLRPRNAKCTLPSDSDLWVAVLDIIG